MQCFILCDGCVYISVTYQRPRVQSSSVRRYGVVSRPVPSSNPLGLITALWLCIPIWAGTQLNLQNGCAPSKDPDQPAHPRRLISVSDVRIKKLRILKHPAKTEQTARMLRLILWVFAGRTSEVVSFAVSRLKALWLCTINLIYGRSQPSWQSTFTLRPAIGMISYWKAGQTAQLWILIQVFCGF